MRLAGLEHDEHRLAVVEGGRARAIDVDGVATLDELVRGGARARATARATQGVDLGPIDAQRLGPPLRAPSKIVSIGLNYRDHAVEQGTPLPERPLVFAKFPSSIAAPGSLIKVPVDLTRQVDYEGELTVVIGRVLAEVDPDEALEGVFGYTAANDVSARDLQFTDGQWVRGKSLDTFCPLGPVVVTADEFGRPDHQAIRTRVNGHTLQESDLSQLIFGIAELLSFLSRHFTLQPGDLVLTGTPAGVGAFRAPPVFLRPGDVVEVEIEGIGVLRNEVAQR